MRKHFDIKIFGRVQGVFFRDSAEREAKKLGINGFARNKDDGTVCIGAEGEEEVLEKFLEWCNAGPFLAKVERVEKAEGELKNFAEFSIFNIRNRMKRRLFVAIPLSEYFRKIFVDVQGNYDIEGIRWTAPENLHITVYFIGYAGEKIVPKITGKLRNACTEIGSFDLEFDKVSLAPHGRPARMIWAVFSDKNRAYKSLVGSIFGALEEFVIIDHRGKEYIPHVTLARFKYPHVARDMNLTQPNVEHRTLAVSSCNLMESKLSASGPRYSIIETCKLL